MSLTVEPGIVYYTSNLPINNKENYSLGWRDIIKVSYEH